MATGRRAHVDHALLLIESHRAHLRVQEQTLRLLRPNGYGRRMASIRDGVCAACSSPELADA